MWDCWQLGLLVAARKKTATFTPPNDITLVHASTRAEITFYGDPPSLDFAVFLSEKCDSADQGVEPVDAAEFLLLAVKPESAEALTELMPMGTAEQTFWAREVHRNHKKLEEQSDPDQNRVYKDAAVKLQAYQQEARKVLAQRKPEEESDAPLSTSSDDS